MKIALGIEYDGGQYYGWQSQPDLRTVQGALEKALSKVAASQVQVTCAGRTDTGVHGLNQVVSFTPTVERQLKSWIYGSNSNLPKDIVIKWAREVDDEFDARFTATARRYRYVIYNNPIRPAHLRSAVTWHYNPLNADRMHQEAQCLLGEQDFTSFRSSQCQSKTPMRCVNSICVTRKGDLIFIDIEANAFLHHMVRNIAGVLMLIGNDQVEQGWMATVLAAKDRSKGAETAPPYGLYLFDVCYPSDYHLPKNNTMPLHYPFEFRSS